MERLFHQQLQFTRSFKKKLNEKLAEIGLFHSQWLVMYCINKQQPVTLVEVSNYLDVEKPTVTRTVKRLEEQALVEAIPSSDKRERLIRLTAKGEESYQKGKVIVSQFEESIMAGIEKSNIDTTMQTIQSFKEKLNKGEIN